MNYLIWLVTTISMLGFLGNLGASSVRGQEVRLKLAPGVQGIVIAPGRSMRLPYQLENRGDPSFVTPKIEAFTGTKTEGVQFNFDGRTIFMKTHQREEVILEAQIPSDLAEGDYYYTLFLEASAPPPNEGASEIRIKPSIGSHLLFTVTHDGRVEMKAAIEAFEFPAFFRLGKGKDAITIVETGQKIPVTLRIKNTGANFIRARGEVGLAGGLAGRATYVIPSQTIVAESEKTLLTDTASPVTLSGFFLGPYTLSAEIHIGQSGPVLFAKEQFIALPVRATGMIVAGMIGIVGFKILTSKKKS